MPTYMTTWAATQHKYKYPDFVYVWAPYNARIPHCAAQSQFTATVFGTAI